MTSPTVQAPNNLRWVIPHSATTFVTPVASVTIGTTIAAVDVLDFAPEAAGAIKIIATNNGTGAVVLTSTLVVQEAA
jgi:Na+-transporting methylmalonyl-CoA/oxaloacetate decarboxylase beta subunit